MQLIFISIPEFSLIFCIFLEQFIIIAEQFCYRLLRIINLIGRINLVICMELDYYNVGRRIALRREKMKFRQNEFADKIGISNNYLSSIERGKEKPSLEILVKICNGLRVTPDYLLMGNMYSNNVPQNIIDNLRLCSDKDLDLLITIVQHMVDRQSEKWNNDNFA